MSLAQLLLAFLRRDWINETSYRGMVLIETLGVGSSLILFYSIGKLVGGEPDSLREYGGAYFGRGAVYLKTESDEGRPVIVRARVKLRS